MWRVHVRSATTESRWGWSLFWYIFYDSTPNQFFVNRVPEKWNFLTISACTRTPPKQTFWRISQELDNLELTDTWKQKKRWGAFPECAEQTGMICFTPTALWLIFLVLHLITLVNLTKIKPYFLRNNDTLYTWWHKNKTIDSGIPHSPNRLTFDHGMHHVNTHLLSISLFTYYWFVDEHWRKPRNTYVRKFLFEYC